MKVKDPDWQAEADDLAAYLASRCLTREQRATLLSSFFVVAMQDLAVTDFASAMEIVDGLGDRLRTTDDSRDPAVH